MSRIYFHSQHGESEVSGSERFYFGGLSQRFFAAMLGVSDSDSEVLKCWPEDEQKRFKTYTGVGSALMFKRDFEMSLHGFMRSTLLKIGEHSEHLANVIANTMMVAGNDALSLAEHIHSTCEIHGYVEGPNRAWLATAIEQARRENIFRSNSGWESVVELLRSRDDGPVVMSYSVCESFPDQGSADWKDEHDGDDWYDLSDEARWSMAMRGLREKHPDVELRADRLHLPMFGWHNTAFTLQEYAISLRDAEVSV